MGEGEVRVCGGSWFVVCGLGMFACVFGVMVTSITPFKSYITLFSPTKSPTQLTPTILISSLPFHNTTQNPLQPRQTTAPNNHPLHTITFTNPSTTTPIPPITTYQLTLHNHLCQFEHSTYAIPTHKSISTVILQITPY